MTSLDRYWLSLVDGVHLKAAKLEQFYRRIGSSFVGLFAIGLGLIRFKMRRVPIVTTVLLFICGPTMIFFNWYDPDHLIRTAAMAGIMIGVTIFSVRVINKGLDENREAATP